MYGNQNQQQYQKVPEPGNPRSSESWALMQAAVRIRDAVEKNDPTEIETAVRLNWRLWTILQADIVGPNNELPQEIQMNVLTLCKFVDKRTVEYFGEGDVQLLDVLININRELAGGLMQQVPAEGGENATSAQPTEQNEPSGEVNAPALQIDVEG